MSQIVESLFGVSPERYQQQKDAALQQEAIAYALADPLQRATAGIYAGARQLGGGIGRMLGGEDPGMRRVTEQDQIIRSIDLNNPETFGPAAQRAYQLGHTELAQKIMNGYRQQQESSALIGQRQAAAQQSLSASEKNAAEMRDIVAQQQAYAALTGQAPVAAQPIAAEPVTPTPITQNLLDRGGRPYSVDIAPVEMRSVAPRTSSSAMGVDLPQAALIPAPQTRTALNQQISELEKRRLQLLSLPKVPAAKAEADVLGDQIKELRDQGKPAARPSVGSDREAFALDEYNKNYYDLTPAQRAVVNKRVEAEQGKRVPKIEVQNIMPGDKNLADIPAFRASVQRTIEPQLKTITATDQALTAINDSLATGNFAAYRAAQVQFTRAISGAGDLSQRELKAAGADPSLLGGTADYLSTVFSSTPTADTQKKIRSTLQAIQTVSKRQAQAEVNQQKAMALRSPGYNAEAVNEALKFPQLQGEAAPNVGGDLAAQAAAELARRKGGK